MDRQRAMEIIQNKEMAEKLLALLEDVLSDCEKQIIHRIFNADKVAEVWRCQGMMQMLDIFKSNLTNRINRYRIFEEDIKEAIGGK